VIDWKWLAPVIWQQIDRKIEFPWPKSKAARDSSVQSLSLLLPHEDLAAIYPYAPETTPKAIANRRLRECVSSYLSPQQERDLRQKIACWIVSDWGGIKRGSDKISDWSTKLDDYSPERIDAFVKKMGKHRISSWSKMLAFAQPDTQAIYDARTAVAINCILFNMGYRIGFYMPSGRNKQIEPVRKALYWRIFRECFGYHDYVRLLEAIVETTEASDILEVEMALFANAPMIASAFSESNSEHDEPLDSADFMEVAIRDDRRDKYVYWVNQRLAPEKGDRCWSIERAVDFHRATVGTEVGKDQEEPDIDEAWVCEPFIRYAGEAILIPLDYLASK